MAMKRKRTPVTAYGEWVYTRLLQEALTVKELGARIGVKPQNLSNYFHGQMQGFGYRAKIERVLGKAPAKISNSPDKMAG